MSPPSKWDLNWEPSCNPLSILAIERWAGPWRAKISHTFLHTSLSRQLMLSAYPQTSCSLPPAPLLCCPASRTFYGCPILTIALLVLTPPDSMVNHFMCSQSGSIQDLAACSGHPPSCNIGSDTESDSNSRQDFVHPPSLPTDMGLRYMTIPATDDVQ